MARIARMALDIALVSIKTVKPVITKAWVSAKCTLSETRAASIIANPVVAKFESSLDNASDFIYYKLTEYRNQLLPKEEEYLEKQLQEVRRKMRDGSGSSGSWG